jgi:putative transposase
LTNETVVKLVQPPSSSDPLTEVLLNGARDLLAQAVAAEVAEFLGTHAGFLTEDGLQRCVRHGSLAEREVVIGIGLVIVPQPRVRNRGAATVALSVSASRR